MLSTQDIISQYLNAVVDAIKADAAGKGQKIPVNGFRIEVAENSGKLYGADYFKYLVTGRGPGKFPPPDKMLKFVQDNPDMLAEARQRFKYINEKGLAFLIGRKIARQGTDIFQGKKQGIDFEGSVEVPKEKFLQMVAYYQALHVAGRIKEAA